MWLKIFFELGPRDPRKQTSSGGPPRWKQQKTDYLSFSRIPYPSILNCDSDVHPDCQMIRANWLWPPHLWDIPSSHICTWIYVHEYIYIYINTWYVHWSYRCHGQKVGWCLFGAWSCPMAGIEAWQKEVAEKTESLQRLRMNRLAGTGGS